MQFASQWLKWWMVYLILGIGVGIVCFDQFAGFYVNQAWFQSLGYWDPFWRVVKARWAIGAIGFALTYSLLWINIRHAWRQPSEPVLQLIFLIISGSFAWILSEQWLMLLAWWQQTPFETQDPLFHRDVSFFIFSLPVWDYLQRWSFNLVILILVIVSIIYLTEIGLAKQRLTLALTFTAQRHLLLLGAALLGILAWGHWLSRYQLLYSTRGTVFGAGYADIHAQLPANTALAGIALLTALAFIWIALRLIQPESGSTPRRIRPWVWALVAPILLTVIYGVMRVGLEQALPDLVQALIVTPNGFEREEPYIERSIEFTRHAFNLDAITVKPFQDRGRAQLTMTDIETNVSTIDNIRLWDPEPLLASYRQLQEIRAYYQFPFVDVDRYTIGGELRQVMHAARELDYSRVPQAAKKWDNEHFFYTHGNGITLSPVNVVTREGLPDFYIANIPPEPTNAEVEAALPIDEPAIYYGELTTTDVITGAKARELHYPKEDGGYEYNRYAGTGGIPIPHLWQRLLVAWHVRDPRILISREYTEQSRYLFRRTILDRARRVTPFLRYDQDPYLVITGGRLYWILDAYTTSERYPYSEPAEDPTQFNYIRNTVKAVIDAYNGTVDFYISDPEDPVILTYQRLFPELFKPLDTMPAGLRRQIRYPLDLFRVQMQQFATYHMVDPQIFYNREDQWQISSQVRNEKVQTMDPQYLILKLPDTDSLTAEFVLFAAFTPIRKQNMIAWMAAGCDGDRYGELIVYEFPKGRLIFGPQQIEARINQNPEISERISLWNEHGSRVNQGNLLVFPIENSLLYVQPLYLESEDSRLPQLTRILAAYEDQVVMEPTLETALEQLFNPSHGSNHAEEDPLPLFEDREDPLPFADLVEQAQQLWQQAEQARRAEQWDRYETLYQELGRLLEQLDSVRSLQAAELYPGS